MQDGGQQPTPEEMAMMEQQQAQQQGAPQQGGGQDEAMQQIMQMVEQMIQQGAQPADVAAELLGQQVPPEAIMQVFVQMGLPEQEAQAAIEQAMQAGPPAQEGAPQGPPQGQPSPEEMAAMQQQQGAPPMMEHGGPSPHPTNTLMNRTKTTFIPTPKPKPEFTIDDKQYIQNNYPGATIGASGNALDVNGNVVGKGIRPEFHTSGKYFMGADKSGFSSDTGVPTALRSDGTWGPIGAIPNSQYGGEADNIEEPMLEMQKYGGQFKKLMKKAWGGDLNIPGTTSDNYVSERASMFVNKVKQNTGLASLNQDMTGDPLMKSLGGESLPIAELGAYEKWAKAQEQKKAVAEYNAYRNDGKVEGDEGYTSYDADDADYGEFLQSYNKRNNIGAQAQNNSSNGVVNSTRIGANNTVGYGNPFGGGWRSEAYRGTSPFARLLANSGRSYNAPIIRGNNLPGGMSGANFLGQMGAQGMTGKTADGTPYQISAGEKFKEGSFFNPFQKRRKGIRYNIDYGTGLNADGTVNPEGATSEEGAALSTSGAMSKNDMLNSMTKNEKRQFRKLQRGRNQMSANDAYNVMKGDRGGTEDPAQTGVNDPNARVDLNNPAGAGDVDDLDLDNNAGLDEIANAAAEVDPALADAGAQEAQGFQPMTEADLTKQQLRQIKNGKLSLDGINQDAQQEFDVNAQIAGADQARIDEVRAVMNDPNANVASPGFARYQKQIKNLYAKEGYNPNAFEQMNEPGRKSINFGEGDDYGNPGAVENQSALENAYKDYRATDTVDDRGEKVWGSGWGYLKTDADPSRFDINNPNAPTIQNPMGNQPMSIESLPLAGQEKPAVSELQITDTDPNQEFGKRTTRQLQKQGVLDANGNVVSLEGETPMPPTAEEMQANADRAQREQDQIAAMEQGVIDQENRQQVGELFDAQNPIASSDKEVAGQRILELQAKGRESMDPFTLSEERMPAGSVPVQPGLTYGGGVDNKALMNAVNLINRAFGGNAYAMPQAVAGMDLQGRLSMEEAMAKQGMNPGQIDVLEDSQFYTDQGALGQTFRKGVGIANFGFDYADDYVNTQKARGIRQDPLENIASYQGMGSGIHNQQGQDYANNVNAQSLNVTGNYSVELGGMPRQMMEYGGQMYEIGGSVNITDEEKRRFEAAGFTLT